MALKDFVGKVGSRPEPADTASGPSPEPTRRPEPPAPARTERASAPVALLDASVEFKGTIVCRESIRIDGRCEGELRSDHAVIIGQPARLRMSIEADSVVVAGEVDGDITARRKITLEPTARVHGNLCTPGIVIQEGAKLEGRIVIDADQGPGASAETEPPAPREEPSAARPEATAPRPEAKGESRPAREAERPRKPTPNVPPPSS